MEAQSCAEAEVLQAEGGLEDEEVEVDLRRTRGQAVAGVVGCGEVRCDGGVGGRGCFRGLGDLGGRDVGGFEEC